MPRNSKEKESIVVSEDTKKIKKNKKTIINLLILLTYWKKHDKIFKRMYEILHGSHRFKEILVTEVYYSGSKRSKRNDHLRMHRL